MNIINPLANLQWYRRARAGYWAQATSPFLGKRWMRVDMNPTPDQAWTYYPWCSKGMGNGYIDEWYMDEDGYSCYALSLAIVEACGTCDPKKIKELVKNSAPSTPPAA